MLLASEGTPELTRADDRIPLHDEGAENHAEVEIGG